MSNKELANKIVNMVKVELGEDGGIDHAFDYAFEEDLETKLQEIKDRVEIFLDNES